MESEWIVVRAVEQLEASGVPYMLVGSFATNVYGVQRSTMDVDFVVHLEGTSLASIVRAMGEEFELDPQFAFESVTSTTRRIATVKDSRFRLEFFYLSDDPHDLERFSRRRRAFIPDLNREAYVCTKEDVVVTKLRWARDSGRSKDREDVAQVLAVRLKELDWDYVHRWADEHGTRALLDEIRASLPDLD